MAIYAIVNSDSVVENLIVWDGISTYAPPEGTTLVYSDGTAIIGGTWDGSAFVDPVTEVEEATE